LLSVLPFVMPKQPLKYVLFSNRMVIFDNIYSIYSTTCTIPG